MHPFYFGTSQKPLFGVYHPPHRGSDRHRGVVICYPFGQEYMRGHRAFRQLGLMLSRTGFHVLRFDYYGTGDSGGNATEVTLSGWVHDVRAAADELMDMAELPTVSLVGTRLGAAIGVEAAVTRSDIDAIVLWDPVVSGADYLKEIVVGADAAPSNGNGAGVIAMVHGFPMTRALSDELRSVDIAGRIPQARTRIIVSSEQSTYSRLRHAWPNAEYVNVPSKGNWNELDNFGSALVPQEIIRDIVEWFGGAALEEEVVT